MNKISKIRALRPSKMVGKTGFQAGTRFLVADNSGILIAECICVLGNKKYGQIGDEILAAGKKFTPSSRADFVKKVLRMKIIRSAAKIRTEDGGVQSFGGYSANAAVLINAKHEVSGTRIFGPIARSRFKNIKMIASIAEELAP